MRHAQSAAQLDIHVNNIPTYIHLYDVLFTISCTTLYVFRKKQT